MKSSHVQIVERGGPKVIAVVRPKDSAYAGDPGHALASLSDVQHGLLEAHGSLLDTIATAYEQRGYRISAVDFEASVTLDEAGVYRTMATVRGYAQRVAASYGPGPLSLSDVDQLVLGYGAGPSLSWFLARARELSIDGATEPLSISALAASLRLSEDRVKDLLVELVDVHAVHRKMYWLCHRCRNVLAAADSVAEFAGASVCSECGESVTFRATDVGVGFLLT